MRVSRDTGFGAAVGPERLRERLAAGFACFALLLLPCAATGEDPACAADTVCKQTGSPPADDWFRHGIEALAEDEGAVAACALDRALRIDPSEDGRNLTTFVKPMTGGVKSLPRDCTQSSAPLDKKKYFPGLYLAKAYLELALRSADEEKEGYCSQALRLLASSREKAPQPKVLRQWERRERIDRALKDSRCCDLSPDDATCAEQK